jgi:hypothetical protein
MKSSIEPSNSEKSTSTKSQRPGRFKSPFGRKQQPDDPITGKRTSLIAWEAYLWLIFLIQMLSWALMLAGQPTVIEYIDPVAKFPAWILVWCFFRGHAIFLQKERRSYFYGLLAWEVVYALFSVLGFGGVAYIPAEAQKTIEQSDLRPGLAALVEYAIIFLPLYWALWRYTGLRDEEPRPEVPLDE